MAAAGILAVSFLWAGMVLGVAFLATPAKFLAPSLTLPVALDVGRHTFHILNRVEIGWSLALLALILFRAPSRWAYAAVAVACGTVLLETAWLLPVLDARVATIIAGGTPPASNLHTLYIALDGLKLAALLALASGSLHRLARAASNHPRRSGSIPALSNGTRTLRLDNRRSSQ